MRVMVARETRFLKTKNGNIYSRGGTIKLDRYLHVFDEVIVFARVQEVNQEKLDKPRLDSAKIKFFPLPYYVGPWQFLKQYPTLRTKAKQAIQKANAFILRIPGPISTLLWRELMKRKILYGVEVVGDPYDAVETCGANILLRFILKKVGVRNQKKQCKNAAAATYITEHYLQSRYPPGGWSTHCSNVELPDEAIVDNDKLKERFASLDAAVEGRRPFRICHVGTMDARYKAQDILMEAVALCLAKALDINLVLVGDGRYRQFFEEKAKMLGIFQNVRFFGNLPVGGPVREQLDAADMFVFPSLTEGQGRTLIEAMARGLPCIGSDVGGITELIESEDRTPPGNAELLAAKIESTLEDMNRLKRMSQRNLKEARKYYAKQLNQRRVAFYERLIEAMK